MNIPIQNIYFLLCYAWDVLEEGGMVHVRQEHCRTYADLFASVLESGMTHLLKRGLDRGYITEAENTPALRGKFDVSTTVKQDCLQHARVHCQFDSLSHNVIHNQIVKTTIGMLVRCADLDPGIRNRLLGVYRRLHDISAIELSPKIFGRVTLHRNNGFYGFLLNVCRLIYDNLLIDERTGSAKFRDFLRDEKAMPRLFERFVRNFFRREQVDFWVGSRIIEWQGVVGGADALAFLPQMRTDVSLESSARNIVIDAKYYVDALQRFHSSDTIRSGNLYQIFAYLRNLDIREGGRRKVEGVLLYPTVSRALELEYIVQGYRIRVLTLDLDADWRQISHQMLGILA
jgi:5-methylcytosine-specific restriction enzyme subunit McrC